MRGTNMPANRQELVREHEIARTELGVEQCPAPEREGIAALEMQFGSAH
jgi:hypothetical protein